MKAKNVTVQFDYTNFDSLELMLNRLKSELMQGKEYFEDVVKDSSYNDSYLHFQQEYKRKSKFKIEDNVILIKSKI